MNLKGQAQIFSIRSEVFQDSIRLVGDDPAQFGGKSDQGGGFSPDHCQIGFNGDRCLGLKGDIQILPLGQVKTHLVEAGDGLLRDFQAQGGRQGEHAQLGNAEEGIPSVDGLGRPPFLPQGGTAMADGGIVFDIIVNEGEVVQKFNRQGAGQGFPRRSVKAPCAQKHQKGANSLTPGTLDFSCWVPSHVIAQHLLQAAAFGEGQGIKELFETSLNGGNEGRLHFL